MRTSRWSWPTWCCARRSWSARAAEQRIPLEQHYAHLLVHGTLHAQGHDHEKRARGPKRMEARETEILRGLGFPDPYAG